MKPTAAMIEGFYHTVLTKAQWERMCEAKEDALSTGSSQVRQRRVKREVD